MYAKWLKESRKKKKLKQVQLAEMISVAQSTISRIEKNKMKPSVKELKLLFAALNTPKRKIVELMTTWK